MASSVIKYKGLDLLWTNQSLTTNFTAKTLNIDCSKYTYLLIETYWNVGARSVFNTLVRKNISTNINLAYNRNYFRNVTFNDSSIVFGDCNAINNYNNATSVVANDNLIIHKIYGIK